MDINFRVDDSQLKSITKKQLQRQGRYSMMLSLNNLAFDARKKVQTRLPRWLRLTKRFIPSSVVVEKARITKLVSKIGFLDRVPLINLMESGGTNKPKGRAIAVPTRHARRSKRGSITAANRPRRLLSKKNVFSGTVNGVAGIWKRNNKKLTLLYAYETTTSYEGKYIKFKDTVELLARRSLPSLLEKNLTKAISTMKK